MSFIKIKDPRKREEMIKDLIETRKRIKDNFIARKVGEIEYQTGLTKLFKPVIETQKATAKEITDAQKAAMEKITQGLLPIKAGIEGLPGAISFPTYPALEMTEEEEEEEEEEKIKDVGKLALNYLAFATGKKSDTSLGIYPDENKELKIGNKKITVIGNDIKIEDKTYTGTTGLWELIVRKELPKTDFTDEDYINYGKILKQTNAIYQNNNPMSNKPKSNKGDKWKKLIKPIWDNIKKEKGKGIGKGIGKRQEDPKPGTSGTCFKFLSSDPNALIDRFDLLFSSKKAGHTGVRNEIISILDELKRQGVINVNEYKKLNSLIKNDTI